jgi:D-glycero-alpha-D-manno-heptose-7-phosphate kinase
MIISRTPFRVSFFGGGTDYPTWLAEHGGAVLGTSINHYCYLSCRHLPPFFEHKYRIAYSKTENVKSIAEIEHPVVRAVLEYLGFQELGMEIHHDADLPARSGIGSSSTFTVGLLNALIAFKHARLPTQELAKLAIYIEQEMLNEAVGSQDQILAAHGGFNRVDFYRDGKFTISPVIADPLKIESLQKHCMLFFTGFSRFASEIAKSQISNMKANTTTLHLMRAMVDDAMEILENPQRDIREFGELLHQAWECKRTLSDKVSTDAIDEIYQRAREAGAIGGKLLGAGGGGFILLFASPEDQEKIKAALSNLIYIPFAFENQGSRVIFHENTGLQEKKDLKTLPLSIYGINKLHV